MALSADRIGPVDPVRGTGQSRVHVAPTVVGRQDADDALDVKDLCVGQRRDWTLCVVVDTHERGRELGLLQRLRHYYGDGLAGILNLVALHRSKAHAVALVE